MFQTTPGQNFERCERGGGVDGDGDGRAVAVLESTIVRKNCVRIGWELVMNAILYFLNKTIYTIELETKQCNMGNSLVIQGIMGTLQNCHRSFLG